MKDLVRRFRRTIVTFSTASVLAVIVVLAVNAATSGACCSPSIATALSPSSPITVGTSVHDTATLSGASSNVGGTVTYTVYTNSNCSTKATSQISGQPAAVTVTKGVVPNSASVTFNQAGTYYWQASYSGDSDDYATVSTCSTETLVVNKAGPSITTALSSGSINIGQSVNDTATLSGATANAGGTVTYTVYTNSNCSTAATTQISGQPPVVTVTGGVVPNSASVTFNQAGTYYWQAFYSGDSNNAGAISGCSTETLVVNKAGPSITTALSPGSSIAIGGSVHDTATLSGASSNAGGTVTYTVYTNSNCSTAATTQISGQPPVVTVTGGVVPNSASVTFNQAGTYYWQAFYSGDSNNAGAISGCSTETLVVNKAGPSITTALSSGSINIGQSVNDTATLSGATANAGGTVTYTVYTNSNCSTAATTQISGQPAVVTVTKGVVPNSASVTFNQAGTYYWQAFYSGDSSNMSALSTCGDETLVVSPASTTTETTASTSSVTLGSGATVTDTATVSGPTPGTGLPTPTGTVSFYLCLVSSATAQTGTCAADSANLVAGTNPVTLGAGSGDTNTATSPAYTPTAAGSYCFSAVYSGDTNYNGSSDNLSGTPDSTECFSVTLPPAPPKGSPKLTATKDSIPKPGSIVKLGSVVEYLVKLTNSGTAAATGVNVTDRVPTDTTYVAGSASCHGDTGCTATESGNVVSWTGLTINAGTSATVSFKVTVNKNDTNGQVIPNVALFSNKGTPSCSATTCNTNTVKVNVKLKVMVALPKAVPEATKPHTGEPFAGSRPYEIAVLVLGAGLLGFGERSRRRLRRATRRA